MKLANVKASSLRWNARLYPRSGISDVHISRLADALRVGAKLPPLIVDEKSRRIVDGAHRWKAHIKVFGAKAEIPCELRKFASKAEFLLAAVEANAAHGLQFTPFELTRIATMSEKLGITREVVASALKMPAEKIEKMVISRTGFTRDEVPERIPLRGAMRSFAGEKLTAKQEEVNRYSGGMAPRYYVNQLVGLIRAGIVGRATPGLMDALHELRDLLNERLPRRQRKAS